MSRITPNLPLFFLAKLLLLKSKEILYYVKYMLLLIYMRVRVCVRMHASSYFIYIFLNIINIIIIMGCGNVDNFFAKSKYCGWEPLNILYIVVFDRFFGVENCG